ncbi:MAG: FkbM family methyltransferase [Terracidiphilus sp.]
MFLSRYRKAVDTWAPPLGRSYRLLRDSTNRRRAIQTPYGFSLAGDPSMANGGWEADEVRTFLDLVATHDAVLDIGANVGLYSCLAASRGKQTIAIEPSPRNLSFLYRNLWDNHFTRVETLPVGLGSQPGLARIYGYGGIASFVPGWAQAREAQSTVVPLTTLDAVAAHRFQGKKLLIKMDVEGFELDVLAGAEKTLELDPRPTWLIEILFRGEVIPGGVSQKFTETFHVFWGHGYRCRKLDSAGTPVEAADVGRWVAQGSVDGETHDFLFWAD